MSSPPMEPPELLMVDDNLPMLGANAWVIKPVGLDQFSGLVRAIEAFWLGTARLPSKTCRNCA